MFFWFAKSSVSVPTHWCTSFQRTFGSWQWLARQRAKVQSKTSQSFSEFLRDFPLHWLWDIFLSKEQLILLCSGLFPATMLYMYIYIYIYIYVARSLGSQLPSGVNGSGAGRTPFPPRSRNDKWVDRVHVVSANTYIYIYIYIYMFAFQHSVDHDTSNLGRNLAPWNSS